ncbi:MAG TPA: F390 synthetase-related protein [Dehalococcoidia bacterium]
MNILSKLLAVRSLDRQFYRWDEASLHKHQLERISRILKYARNNSPYYRRVLSGQDKLSLSAVTKIDKKEMMEHFNEINTAGLHKDELMDFQIRQEKEGTLNLYRGKFSVGISSGTSGNKGLTVLSPNERDMYSCLLWARNGIPQTVKDKRVLFALRTNNPAFMEVQSFGIKIVYVDYTHPTQNIINIINEQKLNIIAGPPSLLSMIARHFSSIKHRIETVISYAEVLNEDTQGELEKIFGVPMVQIYQGSEGFIGSTCRNGKLHLNEDVIFVELEDAGDTVGKAKNVVVTDLYRTTQPIIRYSLNDILEISAKRCQCGSSFRAIERIQGRADDIFYVRGPGSETRYLFPDYVQKSIIHASDAIIEYQAIQHSIESIEIRLVLKEGADRAAIETAVLNNLRSWAQKAGGELGDVYFTDALPERNPVSKKLIRVIRAF